MSAADDLEACSTQSSPASDDPGGWETMHVELFDGVLEWLAQILHEEGGTPLDSQGLPLLTPPGDAKLPKRAILRFNTADRVSQTCMRHTCPGWLDLDLGTVPVSALVYERPWRVCRLEDSLRREQATLAPMHPRIKGTLGFGVSSSHMVAVLPDLSGAGLRTYLRYHPNADKRRLIIQIAEGLEYLHHHAGVVSDLEASSVHVTDFGDVVLDNPMPEPLLLDFALEFRSRLDHPEKDEGPLQYLAPEILLPDQYPPRFAYRVKTRERDMYAFGMLVYEILLGREPWADATLVEIFRHVVSGGLLPRPDDGTIGDSMWNLCTACWNQNPEDRPGIANVLAGLRSNVPLTHWRPDIMAKIVVIYSA